MGVLEAMRGLYLLLVAVSRDPADLGAFGIQYVTERDTWVGIGGITVERVIKYFSLLVFFIFSLTPEVQRVLKNVIGRVNDCSISYSGSPKHGAHGKDPEFTCEYLSDAGGNPPRHKAYL